MSVDASGNMTYSASNQGWAVLGIAPGQTISMHHNVYRLANAGIIANLTSNTAIVSNAPESIQSDMTTLSGGNYDDILIGDAGQNGLVGENGNDVIIAMDGDDLSSGGVLYPIESQQAHPTLLVKEAGFDFWFKQDATFRVAKANPNASLGTNCRA